MNRSATMGVALLLAGLAATAHAAPKGEQKGHDTGQLGAEWWQLVMSLPADVSPFFDETKCGIGQRGNTWFLYSTALPAETVGDPVDVSCAQIPTRTPIFLSLVTGFCTPDLDDTLRDLRAECAQGLDAPGFLRLEIDGVDRSKLIDRGNSKFTLPLGDDNIFAPDLPGGVYTAVHDGYYALLPPLSAGDHEVIVQGLITLDDGTPLAFSTRHLLTIVKPDARIPLLEEETTQQSNGLSTGRGARGARRR